MMNKVVNVTETMTLRYNKQGAAFITIGVIGIITGLINLTGTIGMIVQFVIVILAAMMVLLCVKTMRLTYEDFDEMAEEHFYKAKARARDVGIITIMVMVYGACAIYLALKYLGYDFNSLNISLVEFLVNMLFIFLGINDLAVGKEFAALEEE